MLEPVSPRPIDDRDDVIAALDVRMHGVMLRTWHPGAVDGVDLRMNASERVALTGLPAGVRTGLLRAVAGLAPDARGEVRVGGRGVRTAAERAWRSRAVAWMPGGTAVPCPTVEAGALLARALGPALAVRAAERAGIVPILKCPVGTLTRGRLRRLFLARALGQVLAGAGVLLADEPTLGLDARERAETAGLLLGLPVTLLVATDDPLLVSACDRSVDVASLTAGPHPARRRAQLTESDGNSLPSRSDY